MKKSVPLLIVLALLFLSAGKPASEPRCFDPWINGMCWSHSKTFINKAGEIKWGYPNNLGEQGVELEASISYYNQTRTEIIMFGRCPGGTELDFCAAEILPNKYGDDPNIRSLKIKRFTTGRGLRLGMSMSGVKKILGRECRDPKPETNEEPSEPSKDETGNDPAWKPGAWLEYNIWRAAQMAPSEQHGGCVGKKYQRTLDEYGMPVYNSSYLFNDGKLIRISLSSYP